MRFLLAFPQFVGGFHIPLELLARTTNNIEISIDCSSGNASSTVTIPGEAVEGQLQISMQISAALLGQMYGEHI